MRLWILAVTISLTLAGAARGEAKKLVEFEELGSELSSARLDRAALGTLRKLGIDPKARGVSVTDVMPRLVRIAGIDAQFVFSQDCNAAASGSSEGCELGTLTNLSNGRSFGEKFLIWFRDGSAYTEMKYGVDGNGDLVAMYYVGVYKKTFKGKTSCEVKGSVIAVDKQTYKFVTPKRVALGSKCLPESDFGKEFDGYFKKLLADAGRT